MLQRQLERAPLDHLTPTDWDRSGFGKLAIRRRTLGKF
jgi:hypothetical protein